MGAPGHRAVLDVRVVMQSRGRELIFQMCGPGWFVLKGAYGEDLVHVRVPAGGPFEATSCVEALAAEDFDGMLRAYCEAGDDDPIEYLKHVAVAVLELVDTPMRATFVDEASSNAALQCVG
jgi:hypothetical protein